MVFGSAALEQMPHLGMVKITARDSQLLDRPHIQVVAVAITKTVVAKLAVFYQQHGIFVTTGQNAVFVVGKRAVFDAELAFFKPNARAIFVSHLGADKVKPLHRHDATTHHPNRFALTGRALGQQAHPYEDFKSSYTKKVSSPCPIGASSFFLYSIQSS